MAKSKYDESKSSEMKEHGSRYSSKMEKGECEECANSKKKGKSKCVKCGKKC